MKIFILSLVLGLFSLETMALSCDITNYKDYIWNTELTDELIGETGGVGCVLTKADLRVLGFPGLDLPADAWVGSKFPYADFRNADLREADLREADLYQAKLQKANLWRANLWRANLQSAKLQWANLQQANLEGADLEGANLWRANLQGADLQGADLQGANLHEADLQGADLENAIYNDKTNFPAALGNVLLLALRHNMIKMI